MGRRRKVISVDEAKCTGCGQCIPNCPEGALQVIDGKARLVSDLFCDGLGACVGSCPEGAMTIAEREAEPYDESKVMQNVVKAGPNTIAAHLAHLKEHGACEYYNEALAYLSKRRIPLPSTASLDHSTTGPPPPLPCGCPGSAVRDLHPDSSPRPPEPSTPRPLSRLRNWPIQIALVPPSAPYLKNADILIAADCVGSSHPNFHEDLMKGRVLLIGCPKLDDAESYVEKLTEMFRLNRPKTVTVAHMTVPCCFGMVQVVKQALEASGVRTEFSEVTIDVDGKTVGKNS